MKKTTIVVKIVLFSWLMGVASLLFAGNITISDNSSTQLKVSESNYSLVKLTNKISEINFSRVKTQAGYFTMFSAENYGLSMVFGEPGLPVVKKLIEVPLNATCEVQVLSSNYIDIDLNAYNIGDYVMPAQPPLSKNIDNPEDVEFIFNQASYQQDKFLGQELAKVVNLGMIRGVRIARLEIAPVLYNPVQNKLRVYSNVEVQINFKEGNLEATLQEKTEKYSPYYDGIFHQLINYKSVEGKELITDEPVTYIIVSDPMFEAALQPFIEWKTEKGFQVVEAYTDNPAVGNTTTSIKNYLQNFYNNPPEGYNPQSFVLIVGDVAQIPTFNGTTGGHVSDLYYFTYDGSGDIYPECFYGRFSANNINELQPQIDKTLEYEHYAFPDPSFLDEVVMVAGADATYATTWGNGQINYGTTNYFNAAHGLTSHTYLQPEPSGGNYSQSIRQDISNGVAFGNYTAHCSSLGWANPAFNIGHIAQLTNDHKYPLLIGNCCLSVEFDIDCFGEEILRAANKGAVGYVGGSNSTYWDEDFWFGVGYESVSANPVYNPAHLGAYDRMFHDHGEPLDDWYVTQGQIPSAGDLAVTQSGSSRETYYWEIYHLMGDPSLMTYFSQASLTNTTYAGLMPLGSATFTVNTEPHAYVAISKDGELNGCAMADETGVAEVNMFNPIMVPGDANVVVTGQNIQPYIGTVTVANPEGAYVLFDAYEIDDSNGNDNGNVDFGEYVMLDMSLENLGSQSANNLSATISTDDEYITINTGSHNWPNIPSGNASMQTGAFSFTVDDMIPDQHTVSFDLEVTDGTDTWNSTFNVTLYAPVLSIGSYTIDDGTGNNNGRLDPGETVNIVVPNTNEGGCEALNTMVTALTNNPLITINNASYNLNTLDPGETDDAIINVTVDPDAQVGQTVNISYTLTSTPYTSNQILTMSIGLIVEDFESGGFSMFEWQLTGNTDWFVDNVNPYEGDYSAKSGDINDNQSSVISLTVDVASDDELSFSYKVSSESGYDFLKFYIDNVMIDQWSGEIPWTEASYDVTSGSHTFKWEYSKDYSVSSGGDCAWLDFIVFPPFAGMTPLGVITTVNPTTICQGDSTQLNAYAMGGSGDYTYEWSPASSLNNPYIANPVATPSATTTYYVVVDDGETTVTDNVQVTVNPVPPQPTVTQNGDMLVSSSTSGNQWYNSNGPIAGATAQSYAPTATDDYYVIVTNVSGCESEPSEPYYFVYTGIIEIANNQVVNIYPNPFKDSFSLDYTVKTNADVTISIYNAYGQLITVLEKQNHLNSGIHRINFNAGNFNTGIYYIRIETSNYTVVKRIIHSK